MGVEKISLEGIVFSLTFPIVCWAEPEEAFSALTRKTRQEEEEEEEENRDEERKNSLFPAKEDSPE